MAQDRSAEIAELQAILDAGATSANVDGQTVNYDFAAIRRRIRELQAETDLALHGKIKKRPIVSQINLGC